MDHLITDQDPAPGFHVDATGPELVTAVNQVGYSKVDIESIALHVLRQTGITATICTKLLEVQ
jgi:hypothetical protein